MQNYITKLTMTLKKISFPTKIHRIFTGKHECNLRQPITLNDHHSYTTKLYAYITNDPLPTTHTKAKTKTEFLQNINRLIIPNLNCFRIEDFFNSNILQMENSSGSYWALTLSASLLQKARKIPLWIIVKLF